ncbi:terminase large subunit domain-containing protein [Paradevosia shaoguanensis]|uniref:Mu-like prophage FluMu protein gp28 n=1 Tax=Paradevosia shaoguanensis TaxID=1335043 RepID=A0AA41UD71_9HYPH|nr:terminase family protein [Paradevosia shaoguanensis]MCF1744632.1 hypothetical protein [Paradevosia shaoguanensis]MCI0129115.1 hypothetical protein [Paradevosia shaoguanensis]
MTAPITKEQWEELRRNSEVAVLEEIGLPHVLLPYQAEPVDLLDSVSRLVLFIQKSRRVGLTWGLAAFAALKAAKAKSAGGMDVMYISYSQEMTREFIDACAMWARAYSIAAMAVEETFFPDRDETGDRSIQAFRIRFDSGFEIMALSSAPRTLRGKQGVVIIDEAAFVDNLAELLKSALAFLMWGGSVVVCSTHNGTENEFNVKIQDILGGRLSYRHMKIDFDQALLDGLFKRICLVNGEEWSPEYEAEWRQSIIDDYGDAADEELFCIPTAGTGAWLPGPLIEARMTVSPEEAPILRLELPPDFLHRSEVERRSLISPFMEQLEEAIERLDGKLQHSFGFDFGRVADLTIGKLLAIEKNLRRRSALCFELRGVPGEEQKQITRMVLKGAPNLVGAAFDATGMGWTVAEDMGREFGMRVEEDGSGLVWAVHFSQGWYSLNMPPLKVAFEDDMIALTRDADHLGDLRLVKVIRGVPSIPPIRTTQTGGKGKKRHGDGAVAVALAHFASRLPWREYNYIRVPAHALSQTNSFDTPDGIEQRDWWKGPMGARLRGSI